MPDALSLQEVGWLDRGTLAVTQWRASSALARTLSHRIREARPQLSRSTRHAMRVPNFRDFTS
jgi:hypothetical protein